MSSETQIRNNRKITKILYDLMFKLDFYSQPLSLTYNGKTNFSTKYGVIMTFFTFIYMFFVITDNLFLANKSDSFSYQSSLSISESLMMDFKVDAGIFITLEDINGTLLTANGYMQGNLTIVNMDFYESGNYMPTQDITILKLYECGADAFLTAELTDKFRGKALCITSTSDKTIYVSNIYNSRFYITLKNNPKTSLIDLITGGYKIKVWNTEKIYYNMTYYNVIANFNSMNLSIIQQQNTYYTTLVFKKTTIYSGYFNIRSEYRNYVLSKTFYPNQIERVTKGANSDPLILNLEIILPINVEEIYYQNENMLNSISIIAGYIFLVYSVINICIKKCADFKLYESINNQVFNPISPLKVNELLDSEKATKEKISSGEYNEYILDLAIDEFYKYNQNRGITFTFSQMINYIFCCDCCKSRNQILLEKTYKRSLEELFKSIDAVNVIKSIQEIKIFKEILFDPVQRDIFDHLLRISIDESNVLSAYNTEINPKFENEEELHIIQKSSLKDSFMQLSKQEFYNTTELKLIEILYLDPGMKKKIFNHEEKDPNNKINLYKFLNTKVFSQNSNLSKQFDFLVSFIEKSFIQIKELMDESVEESIQINIEYKKMCDENKILKEILYASSDKGISPKIKKLTNYHPILNSKEINDRQINLMRLLYTNNSNRNLIAELEGVFSLLFDFIEHIFCIKISEQYLNRFYNEHTLLTLRSISHCIKLGFLCLLIFLPFNVYSIIYNYDLLDKEYSDDFMGFGYLSFSRQPNENRFIMKFYVISLNVCIAVFFIYVIFLVIKRYLSSSENDFLDSNYPLSKFWFTACTLRINDEEERKYYQNYLLIQSLSITDNLYKVPLKSKIINYGLICVNVLLIILNIMGTLYLSSIAYILEDMFDNYVSKVIFVSFMQALLRNIFVNLIQFLINFHVDMIPETVEKMKFWLPFIAKGSTTTMNVILSFNTFMGTEGNMLSSYSSKFNQNFFICREDQASNNLIVYMLTEFTLRKFMSIVSNFFSFGKTKKYNLNSVIVDVMTSFYIMNMITLIYPAQGFFSVFVFSIEYLTEMFILVYFKPIVLTIQNPQAYEDYNLFCLTLNLVSLIIVNVIYQNQFQLLDNANSFVTKDPSNLPNLCIHKNSSEDYFDIFNEILGDSFSAFIQSFQMIIFLPSIIVIFQILTNSKILIKNFSTKLQFLLKIINDVNPKRIFERLNQNKDSLNKIFEEYDNKRNEIFRLANIQSKNIANNKNLIQENEGEDEIEIK